MRSEVFAVETTHGWEVEKGIERGQIRTSNLRVGDVIELAEEGNRYAFWRVLETDTQDRRVRKGDGTIQTSAEVIIRCEEMKISRVTDCGLDGDIEVKTFDPSTKVAIYERLPRYAESR